MKASLENTNWVGKDRYHFEVIDSTNKKAKELAEAGGAHGTLVTAECQEAGVGRRGRSWSSEEGAGIYMSLVLRPQIKAEQASMLTLVAAISVAKAVEELLTNQGITEIVPKIKWPNDIVLNKKKICGILTEMSLKESGIDYIVVGIGINVLNQSFPEEIRETASSILLETGKEIDKEQLIETVWQQFEKYYALFLETNDLSAFQTEYEALLINKNEKVKVLDPAGEYEGIARGIVPSGELLVETDESIVRVSAGEVSVRGLYGYV